MGMFDMLKKAKGTFAEARQAFGSNTVAPLDAQRDEGKKPDFFERTFGKLEEKLDSSFERLDAEAEASFAAEQKLYDLCDRMAAEYRDVFTRQELALLDAVEELGERLMVTSRDSRRWGLLEGEREDTRNELLGSLAQNEALPEEVRAEIAQTLEECASVTSEMESKLERIFGAIPMRGRSIEIGDTRIEWE